MDPKQRFYRHFFDSLAVLQDQIDMLESASPVAGERQDSIDHILAGITKLQNEVSDAAEYTPSYDRRQYSEAIKGLQDKLNETTAKVKPRSRFQFRRASTTDTHVDMGAPENDPRLNPGSFSRNAPSAGRGAHDDPAVEGEDKVGELPWTPKDYNKELAAPGPSAIRKPSFSTARNIGISDQSGLHIILPSSAARATAAGSLTDLSDCIVDMSVPTVAGAPFPGLTLKNISKSLIVAGRVNGPVHITGISDSILVIIARQVRIHECSNVDIYLHCTSHPIIEDCSGMRFAPLAACYMTEADQATENQWDQVDDFKWLKADHSPNWSILSESETISEEVWTKVVPGQPGASVRETLQKVGIPRK